MRGRGYSEGRAIVKGRGKEGAIVKGRKGLTSDNQREGACRADGRGRRRRERIQLVTICRW